jgi:hypothetical protein
MLSKIARGAYLLLLTVMIAAWALSAAKSEPAEQSNEQPVWIVFA